MEPTGRGKKEENITHPYGFTSILLTGFVFVPFLPPRLVLMDNVRWITFHGGYDFCYLLKLLTCTALPAREEEFFELLRLYFPCVYDIKFMVNGMDGLHGGLQSIAEDVGCQRIGPMHQAGSDSM